jgi:hypothetical protein
MVRAFTSLLRFGGSAKDRPFREHLDADGWATMEALGGETNRSVDEVRAFLLSAGIFDIRGNEVRIPNGKTGYRQSSAGGGDMQIFGVFGPPGQTAEVLPPFVPPVAEPKAESLPATRWSGGPPKTPPWRLGARSSAAAAAPPPPPPPQSLYRTKDELAEAVRFIDVMDETQLLALQAHLQGPKTGEARSRVAELVRTQPWPSSPADQGQGHGLPTGAAQSSGQGVLALVPKASLAGQGPPQEWVHPHRVRQNVPEKLSPAVSVVSSQPHGLQPPVGTSGGQDEGVQSTAADSSGAERVKVKSGRSSRADKRRRRDRTPSSSPSRSSSSGPRDRRRRRR